MPGGDPYPEIIAEIEAGAETMTKDQLVREVVNLNQANRDLENLLRAFLSKVPRKVAKISEEDVSLAWKRGIQRNPHPDGNGNVYTLTTAQDENGHHDRIE